MLVPTVSELLQTANLHVTEQDLTSTCERCEAERRLSDCITTEEGSIRSYRCGKCGARLLEVCRGSSSLDDPGTYRAGGWTIRPTVDLVAHIKGHPVGIGARRRAPPPKIKWAKVY